jgi:hypothetical protein
MVYAQIVKPPTNGSAVASLVLGIVGVAIGFWVIIPILGIFFGFTGFIPAVLAVIFGHLGRGRSTAMSGLGRGQATAGLIMGYVIASLILLITILWFVVIAVGSSTSTGTGTGLD